MKEFSLVGLGEVLWDMLPSGKKLGGAPANFAYHCQQLRAKGIVVSCIGEDELGQEILQQLKGVGLDTRFIAIDKGHPTGTVSVELDSDGKPSYIIHEDVAWDFLAMSNEIMELAETIDGVCFGSLGQRSETSRNTIRKFVEATKKNCVRVFDVNLRQSYYNREIIDGMLEMSTVFKLNDEELNVIADLLSIKAQEEAILEELTTRYDLDMIALTKGDNGSRLYSKGKSSVHKGFETEVADTVGAGDAFAAVVALGMLAKNSLEQINERANKVASFVCSQSGAMPKLPKDI
ncbi:MAG: carbohydrate kinase family protein [Planctomycetota bacterium]